MQKINKLKLKNFKFFYGENEIDFERKNILIYGENGSGKSSIYWALYTFMQSVFKTDVRNVKKYFEHTSEQNLINRFAGENCDSGITIEFEDDESSKVTKEISNNIVNSRTGSIIKTAAQASDFMSYKLLAKLYDFKHSRRIDLFEIFENEILMFITFGEAFVRHDGKAGTTNASDWWKYIADGMDPRPKMNQPPYKTFINAVEKFNQELDSYLKKITESVNDYLQKFGQNTKVLFKYENAEYDRFAQGSTTKRIHETLPPKIILDVSFEHNKIPKNKHPVNRPQSFLNEARLTAIALAIRFAIFDEKLESDGIADDTPKLLILDDLLLSLDMSNRETVLDVIFSNFQNTQLIILTHDKNFFILIKHKINQFAHENWKQFEMYECERDGIPQPYMTESRTYLEKAEKYFYLHEYEIAGNLLRKEVESFSREFLPRSLLRTKDCNKRDLNGLIIQCKEFAKRNGLDTQIFDNLDRHRKFVLNPTSHDSYSVPKFKSEVFECLVTVKKLRKIQFKTILEPEDEVEFELTCKSGKDKFKFEITIQDDLRIVKEEKKDSILTSGIVNYFVVKNGKKGELQHGNESLKKMYETCYKKSDKSKSADFWNEIIIKSTREPLSSIR